MTLTAMTTRDLELPGATVSFDVRAGDRPDTVPLFMIGSPMAAAGFGTLSDHFIDRTVITYDPRGSERSRLTEPTRAPTPEQHADDLYRIIGELGGGAVDMFASSGGAVNGLALVTRHPEVVRTLVAHEPPLPTVLPDRVAAVDAVHSVIETYRQNGWGAGMAHFIAVVSHVGEFTSEFAQQPAPDPESFGLPTEDDGSRTDPLLGLALVGSIEYEPDFEALRSASTLIVVAAGVEGEGTLANRAAFAVSSELGTDTVLFAGGHDGFLGGEYGRTGEPDSFAAMLRDVLAGSS